MVMLLAILVGAVLVIIKFRRRRSAKNQVAPAVELKNGTRSDGDTHMSVAKVAKDESMNSWKGELFVVAFCARLAKRSGRAGRGRMRLLSDAVS